MVDRKFSCALALAILLGCAGHSRRSTPMGTSSVTQVSGFAWGVQGHPGVQAAYPGSGEGLARQFAYLDSLGVTQYRVDVYPDSSGEVDPSFDAVLDTATARGIEILPVLVVSPSWNQPEATNYLRGHAIGAGFMGRHRGRVQQVEAGNELDNQVLRFTMDSSGNSVRANYWEGSSVDHYVDSLLTRTTAFLRGMTDGIHQRSRGTRIIINANWRHTGFFRALQRDSVSFDIYGYHWYSDMGDFGSEVLPRLPDDGKEIWITEANRRNPVEGYNAPLEQADWIARFAAEVATLPRVRGLFVYELFEERAFGVHEGESYYGLVGCSDRDCRDRRVLKPGFHAYRDAIQRVERMVAARRGARDISRRIGSVFGGVAQLVEQGTFNP